MAAWIVTPVGTSPAAKVKVTTVDQTNPTSHTGSGDRPRGGLIGFFLLSLWRLTRSAR